MKRQFALSTMVTALVLGVAVPGAWAFSATTTPSSLDVKSSNRLADPDDLMSNMAAQQSGGAQTQSFGSTTVQITNPAIAPDSGVESRFVPNTSSVIVPSRH
jgi:hypothetical protein